jgi:hypothetical protein
VKTTAGYVHAEQREELKALVAAERKRRKPSA